jgi:hypothetical protein
MADTRERGKREPTIPQHSSEAAEATDRQLEAERKPQEGNRIARDERLIGAERFPRKGDDE